MALYLVQHGKAFSKEQDPAKGLSPEGVAGCERIASVAAGYGVRVERIEHSGKKRALQTAEIMATALKPGGGVLKRDGLAPLDDVGPLAAAVSAKQNLMLVGHLPFMERLTGQLIVGDPERRVFKFQNGGIVCLDHDDRGWYVAWALMPDIG